MTALTGIMTKLRARRLCAPPSHDTLAHGITALEAAIGSKLPEDYRRFVEA